MLGDIDFIGVGVGDGRWRWRILKFISYCEEEQEMERTALNTPSKACDFVQTC